jgi:hypothetical protein
VALVSCLVALYQQAHRYSSAFSLYEGNPNEVRFTAVDVGTTSASYLALVGSEAYLEITLTAQVDGNANPVVKSITLPPGRHVISCRVVERDNTLELQCICGQKQYNVSLDVRNASGPSIDVSEPHTKEWYDPEQTVVQVVAPQVGVNGTMTMNLKYIANKQTISQVPGEKPEPWWSFLERVPPIPDYHQH